MIDRFHIIIPLVAAIVVTIVNLIQKSSLELSSFRLICTIVVFYVLGVIAQNKIKKTLDEQLYEGLEIYNAAEQKQDEASDETLDNDNN